MIPKPAFFEPAKASPEGVLQNAKLPYGLRPAHFLRVAEDIHTFLYELNAQLRQLGYPPLEDLHDSAGFSGLISRFAAERLWRASSGLVLNQYHNGYPDLIPDGRYPNNSIERGDEGFEIKASRYENGWQGHTIRSGWFAVIQFSIDDRAKGYEQRHPTSVECILAAELRPDDWKWYPAKEGKSRSGTTQIKASGVEKLRQNAAYVSPGYRSTHEALLSRLRYMKRLPERRKLFTLTNSEVAKELGITVAKLKALTLEIADPEAAYFDFGQGKSRQRCFSPDALAVLKPLLEPEDI